MHNKIQMQRTSKKCGYLGFETFKLDMFFFSGEIFKILIVEK